VRSTRRRANRKCKEVDPYFVVKKMPWLESEEAGGRPALRRNLARLKEWTRRRFTSAKQARKLCFIRKKSRLR